MSEWVTDSPLTSRPPLHADRHPCQLLLWGVPSVHLKMYCERRYFRAAKFSRIKLYVTFSRGLIFAHVLVNSISAIMIYLSTHIIFSRIQDPARNARKNMYCVNISTFTVSMYNVLLLSSVKHRYREPTWLFHIYDGTDRILTFSIGGATILALFKLNL